MATITGSIINAAGKPVPFATVVLREGSTTRANTTANASGTFVFNCGCTADNILVSSVGYKTQSFQLLNTVVKLYKLDYDVKEENEVVVTSNRKNKVNGGTVALAVLLLLAIKSQS